MAKARWAVEAVSVDRTVATLRRPEELIVHVGDHVDIRTNKKWAGGNRGKIIELRVATFVAEVAHENRRTRYPGPATKLGTFVVPYSAIEGRIY